jgi:glycosyltransferase involved in cell wall biosynthesis
MAVDVAFVIPVHNERAILETNVAKVHAALSGQRAFSWSLVIAENASSDGTGMLAEALATRLPGVQVRHHTEPGRGRALREAWLASEARVLAYMDADLSTDLDAIPRLVEPVLSGAADIAIGSRLVAGAVTVRGPKRELISRGYNGVLHLALRTGFADAQCGFKAVSRQVARALLPHVQDTGWFFDTELLVMAERLGLRVVEVPVRWTDDPDSRVRIMSTAAADLRGVVRMLWRRPWRDAVVRAGLGGASAGPVVAGEPQRQPDLAGDAEGNGAGGDGQRGGVPA